MRLLRQVSRRFIAPLAVLSGTFVPAAEARAQTSPIPFVDDFVHDGDVSEWRARPIDRQLPSGPGAPQALLWVGQVPDGLVVAAELRAATVLVPGAEISVSLAGADSLRLPPLGWGHQFEFVTLPDTVSCAATRIEGWEADACRAWRRDQVEHRRLLPPLFQREWRIPLERPGGWQEVRGRPAFAALTQGARDRLGPLAPRGGPVVRERPIAGTNGGRGIEILIPWASAPPVPAPDLDAVRLRVTYAGAGGAAEPEPEPSEARPPGLSGTWSAGLERRSLARPLRHHITPCRYGTEGILVDAGDDRLPRAASEGAVPYMTPEASGDLRSLIVLDNEAAGYAYVPEPGMRSPAAFLVRYPVIDVGRDERLCGPRAALARGEERITPPGWSVTGEGHPYRGLLDPNALEVRRLETGDLFVKSGPRVEYSYFGSGQCGACPRVIFDLLHISTETGRVSPMVALHEVVDLDDVEIEVAEDWRRVSVYRAVPDLAGGTTESRWRVDRTCLVEPPVPGEPPTYEPCGAEEDVAEPPRRLRRFYRGEYGLPPEPADTTGSGAGPRGSGYQDQPGR